MLVVGAEVTFNQSFSVDSLLPHTSPQVPTLCMLPPSLTGGEGCSYSAKKPLDLLEASANQMNRGLHRFTPFDKEHSDEFLVELAQLVNEDNWVVLEQCHLFDEWQGVLQQVSQVHTCSK